MKKKNIRPDTNNKNTQVRDLYRNEERLSA